MKIGLLRIAIIAVAGASMAAACSVETTANDDAATTNNNSTGGGAGVGGGTSNVSSSTGNPTGGTFDATRIGASCTADNQCGDGGLCITESGADFLGGGPSEGYCSFDCTDAILAGEGATDPCAPEGICLNFAASENDPPLGRCTEQCTFGTPTFEDAGGMLDGNKCHGRLTAACIPRPDEANNDVAAFAWCRPQCGHDGMCGASGKVCDPADGVCVDSLDSELLDLGELCDRTSDDRQCKGLCVGLYDTEDPETPEEDKDKGICLDPCVSLLGSEGCGGTGEGYGFCLFSLFGANTPGTPDGEFDPVQAGPGDLGACAKLTPKGDDSLCPTGENWFGRTFNADTANELTVCLPAIDCAENGDLNCSFTCDVDADCETIDGTTCQDDGLGDGDKRCLGADKEPVGPLLCYEYNGDMVCADHDPNGG